MATIGGARVFHLEKEIGSIAEGKAADIILVETRSPHLQPLRTGACENVASSIVFCATGADVTHTIINGKLVMEGRKILTLREEDIIEKVRCASEKAAEAYEKEIKGVH